jgi:hypothetical protein
MPAICQKGHPVASATDITMQQPLATVRYIAMQSVATVRVHYNEGTWTGVKI